MRDFPNFPTDNGTVGLVLNQIPYTGRAYIHIHEARDLPLLLDECADFCVAAGATQVYICGDLDLSAYSPSVQILILQRPIQGIEETDACLMPVTEETLDKWLDICNNTMSDVDHAAYMDRATGRKLLQDGGGYFVHRNDELLGIGIAKGAAISLLAAVKKGAGQDVVLALSHALSDDMIYLEVAQTNAKAISLYQRLGFIQTGIKCTWHRVR